jgi:predicted RNA-binding protein with PUA-like domain
MSGYWLLKTEPSTYSYASLERDGRTAWDGVRNNLALTHLRAMKAGDRVLVYHTGDEKAVVGLAKVARAAYPDPKLDDPRLVVVDIAPEKPLPAPVPLADVKAEPAFKDFALVRMSRLSVMPVNPAQWSRLLEMGGLK